MCHKCSEEGTVLREAIVILAETRTRANKVICEKKNLGDLFEFLAIRYGKLTVKFIQQL